MSRGKTRLDLAGALLRRAPPRTAMSIRFPKRYIHPAIYDSLASPIQLRVRRPDALHCPLLFMLDYSFAADRRRFTGRQCRRLFGFHENMRPERRV